MIVRVLITLDLGEANDQQRLIFHDEMQRRSWARYHQSEAEAYCAEFHGLDSDSEALSAVENDINRAARRARIEDWDGVCVVGDP